MATPSTRATEEARATAPVPNFHSIGWRAGDAIVNVLARTGIGPIHLLTTRGRKTGRPHTKPVVPVTHDGKEWLVAPYGVVSWVRNARAAGTVTMRHGRTTRRYAIRETPANEAGPVLKRYVRTATKTRSHFRATKDSPVEDFVAEADRHPVFELIPLDGQALSSEIATGVTEGTAPSSVDSTTVERGSRRFP